MKFADTIRITNNSELLLFHGIVCYYFFEWLHFPRCNLLSIFILTRICCDFSKGMYSYVAMSYRSEFVMCCVLHSAGVVTYALLLTFSHRRLSREFSTQRGGGHSSALLTEEVDHEVCDGEEGKPEAGRAFNVHHLRVECGFVRGVRQLALVLQHRQVL